MTLRDQRRLAADLFGHRRARGLVHLGRFAARPDSPTCREHCRALPIKMFRARSPKLPRWSDCWDGVGSPALGATRNSKHWVRTYAPIESRCVQVESRLRILPEHLP